MGVGYKRFGSEEKLLADPINHLFEVYVAINKIVEQEKEVEKAKAAETGEKQVCPGLRTAYWLLLKTMEYTGAKGYKQQISNGPTDQEALEFFFQMEHGRFRHELSLTDHN